MSFKVESYVRRQATLLLERLVTAANRSVEKEILVSSLRLAILSQTGVSRHFLEYIIDQAKTSYPEVEFIDE
jgi:RNA-binding protein YlmH